MRALMLGFSAGIFMVVYATRLDHAAIAVAGLAGVALCLRRYRLFTACVWAMCVAAAFALCAATGWHSARLPAECTRLPLELAGVVSTVPARSDMDADVPRQRFEFELVSVAPQTCAQPRRVLLTYYGPQRIRAGEGWQFTARLRPPRGLVNPGSSDISRWYAQAGLHAVGSAGSRAVRRPSLDRALANAHHRIRGRLSDAVASAVGGQAPAAVLRAITVADKSGIEHGLWSRFQALGINHLLVISGLHVGMVAGLGLLLGSALGRPASLWLAGRWQLPGPGLALLMALAYTALAGFAVAPTRAFVMLAVAMVALWLGRRVNAWTFLPALVVVLLANPIAALGSGLALSFSAVVALLWLAVWAGPRAGWRALVAVHVYMSVVMLPLGALWFGAASWLAAPVNFVLIPLFSVYLVPLALAGAGFSLLGSETLATLLWQLAAWPLGLLPWGPGEGTSAPGLLALAPSGPALVLAAAGIAVAVVPGTGVRRLASLSLLVPLLLHPQQQQAPRLSVLDVGQGTAVVFSAGGRTLLYDTGGGDPDGNNLAHQVVLPYLRARGVRRLDTLVISHEDNDHAAGVEVVSAALRPARRWYGGNSVHAAGARACQSGRAWRWPGGIRFRFLSPALTDTDSRNNRSCVLLIEVAGQRVLLAGDIEADRERALIRYWRQELGADVLLAGHHGSRSSTAQSWLNHVKPGTALLSYGWGNRFGHPHHSVCQRLARQGVEVHATAVHGAIEMTLDEAGQWQVSHSRQLLENWRL